MKPTELSKTSRYVILIAAFLGWMLSGMQMTVMNLASGSATEEFVRSGRIAKESRLGISGLLVAPKLPVPPTAPIPESLKPELKTIRNNWFAYYQSAFLLGAAAGGLLFGWIADWTGRVRAMGGSILCYCIFAGAGYVAASPEQLLLVRFLSGMGVGGMWPTGVSLAAEAWSEVSRPALSGFLGASANVGIVLLSVMTFLKPVTPDSWRWVMLASFSPVLLGFIVLFVVPESPAWLESRRKTKADRQQGVMGTLLSPPLLPLTLIGILLGTIPLLGGWGVTAWLIQWTEDVGGTSDSKARAMTAIMRAGGATFGSLFGGWIANQMGRRLTYFLISLFSFGLSEFIYLVLNPAMPGFSIAVFSLGCVSTVFFGWLPLYLPELFPTHARATGAGISFNFGRILTAAGVLGTGTILYYLGGNFRYAGGLMSLIYACGMLVILFAPDTTKNRVGSD